KGILAMTMTALLAGQAGAASEIHERLQTGPGGHLQIDVSSGHVTIEGHEEDFVEIDATSTGFPRYTFELQHHGRDVRLVGRREGFLPFGPVKVRVDVRVPIRFDVEAKTSGGNVSVADVDGEVQLKTSGGRIEVEDVEGELEVNTSGGPIRIHNVVGPVEARTSGGNVEVSELQGPAELRSSGGRIVVEEASGRIDAHTSGGEIRIDFDGAPAGEVQTSGGSIQVSWPEHLGTRLDANTSGGRVRIDECFQVSGQVGRKKVQGDVGGGGERLRLRTSGGDIRISGS
ncbi:MAG: DUF4097 family beta strand repeat-containing protein, partial [Myxococcota bacterium]|nr:DUF4097 family beta strand repeat-containing protein [Myxococcota bacterium]